MPRTQTNCPRCRQPVIAEVEQLFDQNLDPRAKQKLLSGAVNFIQCPNCGYEGNLSTPIVYHDPEKELLLTYFPPELGLPVNEQEKRIGPLIKQVLDKLPQEKRKGYLFKPQTMFTMQTMIEKILEGDGITKEMLDAQQKKAKLIERLVVASPESLLELIAQEEEQIDEEFFQLLSRLIQLTMNQGDQDGTNKLVALQKTLVENTQVGKDLEEKTKEINNAIKALQEASKSGLTREKLLDLILNASSDTGLAMLVSLARQGLDYNFFEILTKKIDESSGAEQTHLMETREKLLNMTREIDQAIQGEMENARKLLAEIIAVDDVEAEMQKKLNQLDEYFVEVVRVELETARRSGDLARIEKLQRVAKVIDAASAPPPEIQLIEKMLGFEDDQQLQAFLQENSAILTPEFLQMLNNVILQSEQQGGQPPELIERLRFIHRLALKQTMRMNLSK